MLLSLQNLPYNVTYSDVQALIRATCGFEDMILDNLANHDNINRSQKVTLELASEEDAAILTKKLNGFFMDGHQLQVVPKTKSPPLLGGNVQPQPIQPCVSHTYGSLNTPAPVPPPILPRPAYEATVNQTAFYQLNQPNYQLVPAHSTSNMQPLSYPFGKTSNRQVVWTEMPPQIQNTQLGSNQDSSWNIGLSEWNSNQFFGRNDKDLPCVNNPELGWDINPKSGWNSSDSKRQPSRDPVWDSKRDSKWDDGSDSRRNDNRDTNRNNDRDSRWDRRDPIADKGCDSNRDSHRPSSSAVSPRDRGSSYNSRDREHSRSSHRRERYSPDRKYDNRDDRYHHETKSKRDRSPGNRGRHRAPSPRAKRPRISNIKNIIEVPVLTQITPRVNPNNSQATTKSNHPPGQSKKNTEPNPRVNPNNSKATTKSSQLSDQSQKNTEPYPNLKTLANAPMWRSQLIAHYTKSILHEMDFEYEVPDPVALKNEVKAVITNRIEKFFRFINANSLKDMQALYDKKYDRNTHWVLLRDTLPKVGGTLLSPSSRKGRKPKPPAPVTQPPQFGTVLSNLKVDHRFEPKGAAQQLQPATIKPASNTPFPQIPQIPQQNSRYAKLENGGTASNGGMHAFAQTPGYCPQYPKGDMQSYKEMKKNEEALFKDEDYLTSIKEKLSPLVQTALEEETGQLVKVIEEACKDPEPEEESFCQRLLQQIPDAIKKITKINAIRRLLPVVPIVVRVFTEPPVQKSLLVQFLAQYNTICLQTFRHKSNYVAECGTYDDHDALCALKDVVIGGSHVTMKPLHLAGVQEKKRRENLQNSNKLMGFNNPGLIENSSGQEIEPNEEQKLSKEMKELYDTINKDDGNTDKETTVNATQNEYVSPLKFTDDKTLTDEDNIKQIMSNLDCLPVMEEKLGEVIDDDCVESLRPVETVNLVEDETDDDTVETAPSIPVVEVEDIDLADVDDEDLEDW